MYIFAIRFRADRFRADRFRANKLTQTDALPSILLYLLYCTYFIVLFHTIWATIATTKSIHLKYIIMTLTKKGRFYDYIVENSDNSNDSKIKLNIVRKDNTKPCEFRVWYPHGQTTQWYETTTLGFDKDFDISWVETCINNQFVDICPYIKKIHNTQIDYILQTVKK